MAKNYFAILGVTMASSADEIRSAYRQLAKEYHPDYFQGNSEIFRQIQEAYTVLGNAVRRSAYEKALSTSSTRHRKNRSGPIRTPEPLIPESGQKKVGDISPLRSFQTFSPSFDEVFDWLWTNFSSLDRPKSGRVRDLTIEVPLTRQQALHGGTARIMVPVRAVCPVCQGCGSVGYYECARCAGEGAISGEMPVSVSYPAGLIGDHAVVIPLDRFGIRNLHVTVCFRPTETDTIP